VPRFLFILQYDSFIKTLLPVADALAPEAAVDLFLYKRLRERNWIDAKILSLLGERRYQRGGEAALRQTLDRNYDVAVIGSIGGRFIPRIARHLQRRGAHTRLASGYVGALLQNNPDGFIKGAMRRAFTQLIWTPGSESRIRVLNTGFIHEPTTRVLATGLPRFDTLHARVAAWSRPHRDTILFIEQPNFPKTRAERLSLVRELAATARAYPNHRLVIKPRFAIKTGHTHRPKYLLPDLMRELPALPPNLEVCNDDLYEQFERTDFALTISSTGALEALLAGIPTYFIRDFCGNSNRYGSLDFAPIGSVIDFARLRARDLPPIDFAAARAMMRFDGRNCERLTRALRDLAAAPPPLHRRRPLPLRLRLRTIPPTAALRPRHRQPAEILSLWLQPNVRRVSSSRRAVARIEQHANGSLHLQPTASPPLSRRRRPHPAAWLRSLSRWSAEQLATLPPSNSADTSGTTNPAPPPATAPASTACSLYFCGDTILGILPWPAAPEAEHASPPPWSATDPAPLIAAARSWIQTLAHIHTRELLAATLATATIGGELLLRGNGPEPPSLIRTSAAIAPRSGWLAPPLAATLREHRHRLEPLLPHLYRLLDRPAWLTAAYAALAQAYE
jgi:hypothetical protein